MISPPASEIAELYKQHWQIELFFKWIKRRPDANQDQMMLI